LTDASAGAEAQSIAAAVSAAGFMTEEMTPGGTGCFTQGNYRGMKQASAPGQFKKNHDRKVSRIRIT
jgi:hypothetical protein